MVPGVPMRIAGIDPPYSAPTYVEASNTTAVVGNNASYAQYVQGAGTQASFHHMRGWKTTDDVAKSETPRVVQFVTAEIDRMLGGIDVMFLPNINFIPVSQKVRLVTVAHDLSYER